MRKPKTIMTGVAVLATLALPLVAGAENKLVVIGTDGVTPVMTVADTGAVTATQLDTVKTWPGKLTTNLLGTYTSYGDGSRLTVRSAMGTASIPLPSTAGLLGNVNFRGYGNTKFSDAALGVISGVAEAAFTDSSQPTSLTFGTTAVNTVAATEKLRIAGDGRLRLSNQPSAPANNAACTTGELILDAANGYLYLCTATNTWKRTVFSSY